MSTPTSTIVKRTHHCGELKAGQAGETVHLLGWVDSLRDHGGILFIDLRDRKGITQILFDPQADAGLARKASGLKPESVIGIEGSVQRRPEETVNSKLTTGEIEVAATSLIIHNISDTPPFPIDDAQGEKVQEDLRLTYRYLDLRRPRMRRILQLRHKAAHAARSFFNDLDFLEVETPALFKSTPEGAREYLVPSRLNPGDFYALPQSPQQFKQMLMVAGVERYYQFARCFRDEDLRADRQPEFTQVDIEMSFIDREEMYSTMEALMSRIWKETLGVEIQTPFPRITYTEAMNRFGIDKPDTRFGLELIDAGSIS